MNLGLFTEGGRNPLVYYFDEELAGVGAISWMEFIRLFSSLWMIEYIGLRRGAENFHSGSTMRYLAGKEYIIQPHEREDDFPQTYMGYHGTFQGSLFLMEGIC